MKSNLNTNKLVTRMNMRSFKTRLLLSGKKKKNMPLDENPKKMMAFCTLKQTWTYLYKETEVRPTSNKWPILC